MATIDEALERYLALSWPVDKAKRTPIVHRSDLFSDNTTIFSHYPVEVTCALSPTLSTSFAEHKTLDNGTEPIETEIVGGDLLSIKRLLLWALSDHLAGKDLRSGIKTVPEAYLYTEPGQYTPTVILHMMLEAVYCLELPFCYRVAIVQRQHDLPEGFIGAADYLAVIRTFPPGHHARNAAVYEVAHLVLMRKMAEISEGRALWRAMVAEKPQRMMMEMDSQLKDIKRQMGFRTEDDNRRERAEREAEEREIAAGIAMSLAGDSKPMKRRASGGLLDERESKRAR